MHKYLILLLFILSSCTVSPDYNYKLNKVKDGDSLVIESLVDGHTEEVRLLGIDTPEYSQEPWGKRAREFVLSQITQGESLSIETAEPVRDKYGRLLAFVFYSENGEKLLLNEEILEHGYAEIFILNKWNSYNQRLKEAEAKARELALNIWSSNGLEMHPYEYRKKFMKKKRD